MKQAPKFFNTLIISLTAIAYLFSACTSSEKEKADPVDANIKMYSHVWDEIINKGKLCRLK